MMSSIFIGSIILAIWYVILFWDKVFGLSVILFTTPFVMFLLYLLNKNKKIASKKAIIIVIPIILLASTYFIFNNDFFNSFNTLVIPGLLMFMIFWSYDEKIALNLGIVGKLIASVIIPISYIGEILGQLKEKIFEILNLKKDENKNNKTKKVIKACIVICPLVFVILILLSSADEIFGGIFVSIIEKFSIIYDNIKISTEIFKIFFTICVFVYLSCFFTYVTIKYKKDDLTNLEKKNKDDFTIKLLLAVLNIIYFIFCIIQIKALFLKNVSGNYAEYARQGFFQLMIVSVINLITILVSKKRDLQTNSNKGKYISIMCVIMVLFTFIILLSSAYRMYLYESAFGYTTLRLLVYCSLFTESLLLIPTIMYILNKNIDLTKTYFAIVVIVYVCMNFINFDNIIAKRNVDRYIETGKIDVQYLIYDLGTDATEQLIRLLNNTKRNSKEYFLIEDALIERYDELRNENIDYRDYNISKINTIKEIENLRIDLNIK